MFAGFFRSIQHQIAILLSTVYNCSYLFVETYSRLIPGRYLPAHLMAVRAFGKIDHCLYQLRPDPLRTKFGFNIQIVHVERFSYPCIIGKEIRSIPHNSFIACFGHKAVKISLFGHHSFYGINHLFRKLFECSELLK